jgi:DNA-directed RNA polymerase subunit RPC12/RpoP
MPQIYIENLNEVYGCIQCGTILGGVTVDDTQHQRCKKCGGYILTMREALQVSQVAMNKGDLKFQDPFEELGFDRGEYEEL